jgi:hypothetical protein
MKWAFQYCFIVYNFKIEDNNIYFLIIFWQMFFKNDFENSRFQTAFLDTKVTVVYNFKFVYIIIDSISPFFKLS